MGPRTEDLSSQAFNLRLRAAAALRGAVLQLWRPLRVGLVFAIRNPGSVLELLFACLLVVLFCELPELRGFTVRWTLAIAGGLRATWALLWVDTAGTALALGLTLLKIIPGVLPALVLAWRLRGWGRLRLPL